MYCLDCVYLCFVQISYVFYSMPFLLTRIGMYIGGFVGLYAFIHNDESFLLMVDGDLLTRISRIRSAWISLLPRDEMEGDQWIA